MELRTMRLGSAGFMRQALRWTLPSILALFLIPPSVGDAQVTTAITSTTGASDLGTLVSPPHNNIYDITGGTRPGGGSNLFHSFGDFSIGQGDIANFLNTRVNGSLPDTSNIIGRVTGGNISNIYGTIQTTDFVSANLFLVNPSGFVFGPHGSFDVGGSVSLSTANYLRFEGTTTLFDMLSTPTSLGQLSVAPVVAFGFLGPELPAPITVQGSILQVPDGQSLSLVGGDITVQSGTLGDGTIQAPSLRVPSGQINLVSVASPGEVLVPGFQFGPNIEGASFNAMGTVRLEQGALLDVSGQFDVDGNLIGNGNSGTVFVRGGQLVMDASTIMADTLGTVDGASTAVDIQVSHNVVLTNGAQIVSRTDGPGDGGDITITTTNASDSAVTLSGFDSTFTLIGFAPLGLVQSGAFSAASASGNGGQITITSPNVTMDNLGGLGTFNTGSDNGGGSIAINAGTVKVDGGLIHSATGIELSTFLFPVGTGDGGNVVIKGFQGGDSSADSVTFSNFGSINSYTGGLGKGGGVQLDAGWIGVDGQFAGINTFTFGEGHGGNITVDAGDAGTLSLTNNGAIFSQTGGSGHGGDVTITAGTVTMADFGNVISTSSGDFGVDGVGGNITLNVVELSLNNGTIQSLISNPGTGKGGKVTVRGLQGELQGKDTAAELVRLTDGSSLLSLTSVGTGDGGQISVTAKTVAMDGAAIQSIVPSGLGRGGNVLLAVQDLILSNHAAVTGSTSSNDLTLGAAGNIIVHGLDDPESFANLVELSGQGTALQMLAPGFGQMGNIEVSARTVSLVDGAVISAGTSGDFGTAGDVTLKAESVKVSSGSSITSQAFSAPAGPVTITADQLTMEDHSFIRTSTTSLSPGGDGGSVVVNVETVSLVNGSSIESKTSGLGKGGDVTMNVGTLSMVESQISSSSIKDTVIANADGTTEWPGPAGNINIKATGSFTSNASTVSTSAEANHGGDISITAQNILLSTGTHINANSNAPPVLLELVLDANGQPVPVLDANGQPVPVLDANGQPILGNAGNIAISSASNVIMQNSSVTTEASQASGGQVTIKAADSGMVRMTNSEVITSVAGSDNDTSGGNITIDPQFVVLQNSQILAQAFAGSGGAINIIATSAFIADPASIVDASSTLGISGTVNIQSPLQNVGAELTALTQEFSSAAALLAQQCAARAADGKFSTFVVAAREGLPAEPGGFLASPSLTAEVLGSRLSGRDPQTQLPAVTGLFLKYDPRPIQLAKLGSACR